VAGFRWPRDADPLPNGNTLVVDTLTHRAVEVTPRGEVVWEVYVPWAPYDAERMAHGDESSWPTMREVGVGGTYSVHGGAGLGPAGTTSPADGHHRTHGRPRASIRRCRTWNCTNSTAVRTVRR
jgi:hypothetical protein